MKRYTVFSDGETLRGTARELLERVRQKNAVDNSELAGLSTEQYADAIIEDAPYFLGNDILNALSCENYPTQWDRALLYLDKMPRSRLRILSVTANTPA